jgi:segregation and condensation protein B
MTHDNAAGDVAGESPAGPGLRACMEAILLVVDEPVPEVVLAQVLERPREEIAREIADLAASYTAESRGFDLREVAGGWRFYTREECAPVVERFVRDGQEVRLTQAALETLAVVAYRQPVSRARVSAVRGVNCDGVMRTLTLRGLVEEAGTEHETGAILYRTTGYFLERLGLPSLDDLPDLAPFLPDEIEDADGAEEDAADIAGAPGPGGAANGGAPDSGGAVDPGAALDAGAALDSGGTRDPGGARNSGDAVDPGGAPGSGGVGELESARDPQDADDAGDERTSP